MYSYLSRYACRAGREVGAKNEVGDERGFRWGRVSVKL